MIEAVLLDVGGVFFLPSPERLAPLVERAGVAVDQDAFDRAHYAGVAAIREFREGDDATWTTYHEAYARACGVDDARLVDTIGVLMQEWASSSVWTRLVPGAVDALAALADLGVKLAIVSHSDGTVETLLRERRVCQLGAGTGVCVDAILDSSVVGFAKPDPRIFHVALERLGVDAAHAIHVGDTPGADVDGALAAGIRPVLLDPLDLHAELDVTRVRSLAEVVDLVVASRQAGGAKT